MKNRIGNKGFDKKFGKSVIPKRKNSYLLDIFLTNSCVDRKKEAAKSWLSFLKKFYFLVFISSVFQ